MRQLVNRPTILKNVIFFLLIHSVLSKSCLFDFEVDEELGDFDSCDEGTEMNMLSIIDNPATLEDPPEELGGQCLTVLPVGKEACVISRKEIQMRDSQDIKILFYYKAKSWSDSGYIHLRLDCNTGTSQEWILLESSSLSEGLWLAKSKTFNLPTSSICTVALKLYKNSQFELCIDKIEVVDPISTPAECYTIERNETFTTTTTQLTTTTTQLTTTTTQPTTTTTQPTTTTTQPTMTTTQPTTTTTQPATTSTQPTTTTIATTVSGPQTTTELPENTSNPTKSTDSTDTTTEETDTTPITSGSTNSKSTSSSSTSNSDSSISTTSQPSFPTKPPVANQPDPGFSYYFVVIIVAVSAGMSLLSVLLCCILLRRSKMQKKKWKETAREPYRKLYF